MPAAYAAWLRARLQLLPPYLATALVGAGGGADGGGGDGLNGTGYTASASGADGDPATLLFYIMAASTADGAAAPTVTLMPAKTAGMPAPSGTSPVALETPPAASTPPPATDGDAADAWLVPAHELSELMARGVAADVGRLLQADRSSGWWDVAPQYREALALYGGTVAAVPLGAGPLLMFVRSDVLAAAGQPVPPQSWQALLAFAERYNGMRRPHDPAHALCLPAGPGALPIYVPQSSRQACLRVVEKAVSHLH